MTPSHFIYPFIALFTVAMSMNTYSASTPSSFSKAKKILKSQIYSGQGSTIYSGCHWKGKKIDLTSCNLQNSFSKKWSKRAQRLEIEHVIPASWMLKVNNQIRSCASDPNRQKASKRKWCSKYDNNYRKATSDLVNLYPSVGAINGKRSAKPFAENPSGRNKQTFNGNLSTTITSRVIIPPKSMQGDIARIANYMNRHYSVTYSKRQKSLFAKWAKNDPISQEERQRCELIRTSQGRCVFD